MGIVGDHPEGGIRFDLERVPLDAADAAATSWLYTGSAFTRDAEHPLRATVDGQGVVVVLDEASLPPEVVQRAKLLLRTAWKHATQDGAQAPPRRVHRWRAG